MPIIRAMLVAAVLMVVFPLQGQTPPPAILQGVFVEQAEGEIAGDAAHAWVFEGRIEESVVLSAERYPPNPENQIDLALELYDSDGDLLASDDNSGAGRDALLIGVTLPTTGRYTAVVRNLEYWESGTYRLSLGENPFPAECETPMGEMIVAQMPSAIVGYPVRYRVFMPPCHETLGREIPYILLMHGSNTSDEHWDRLGMDEAILRGMALRRLPPVALALPFGGELANTNTFREEASWEYVILDEFMPHIEATYCLATQPDYHAIGGISRGGFWAFVIAFRHPDLFAALGGHSPFFDLYHAPASHNPLDLSMTTPPAIPFRLWMDRGKDDYAQLNIDLQHQRLTDNGIAHEFMLYPVGQHDDTYWGAHLDDYLAFYTQAWPQNPAELPECLERAE